MLTPRCRDTQQDELLELWINIKQPSYQVSSYTIFPSITLRAVARMNSIKTLALSPAITGTLLYALTKAPEQYRARILEVVKKYVSSKNLERAVTTLKWLFALGLARNVHVFLSEIAQNNFRLRSERHRYVWDREVIVVTGAASGFGALMAKSFASRGLNVMAVDIRDELPVDMKDIKKIHYFKCDLQDRQAVLDLAQDIQKDHGDVSILINNAGVSIYFSSEHLGTLLTDGLSPGCLRTYCP